MVGCVAQVEERGAVKRSCRRRFESSHILSYPDMGKGCTLEVAGHTGWDTGCDRPWCLG